MYYWRSVPCLVKRDSIPWFNCDLCLNSSSLHLTACWYLGRGLGRKYVILQALAAEKMVYIHIYGANISFRWRHSERDGVFNHRCLDWMHNRFFQAQITENIKAPFHWPPWGSFTGDRNIPRTNGQLYGKSFHFMTLFCSPNFATLIIISSPKPNFLWCANA